MTLEGSEDERSQVLESFSRLGRAEVEPLAVSIDRDGAFSSALWDLLAHHDVFSLSFPESVGGSGAPFSLYVAVIETLSVAGGIAGFYPSTTVQTARMLLDHGSADQQQQWFPRLISGQACAAWAFTEPQTGSDPKQIATRAVPEKDGWRLTGEKAFISFAARADVAVVFAQIDGSGLSAFLVDTADPGWRPGPPVSLLAFAGMGTASVFLDGIWVPRSGLIGAQGGGFTILHAGETEAKIRAAATCVGIAQRALDEAARYALARTHRGVAIGTKFPTIQGIIGDIASSVDAARAFVRDVAMKYEQRSPDIKRLAAAARLVSARTSREASSAALQVCGAYGLTKEMVVERLYREGKFFEVAQGVAEIQRAIVAKHVLANRRYGA